VRQVSVLCTVFLLSSVVTVHLYGYSDFAVSTVDVEVNSMLFVVFRSHKLINVLRY
jgi:hypothetical protein